MERRGLGKIPLSRSDQIRQRRTRQNQQPQKPNVPADSSIRTQPPLRRIHTPVKPIQRPRQNPVVAKPKILTRRAIPQSVHSTTWSHNVLTSRPLIERTHNSVRRRLVIPLRSPGAEINLPALPAINFSWRILSGIIAVSNLILLLLYISTPLFRTNLVRINGLERVNPGDVETVLNLINKPIYEIEPQNVKAIIEQNFPDIVDTSVNVSFPSSVLVSAKERIPMVAWVYNDELSYIDKEGYVFPSRNFMVEHLLTIRSNELPPAPAPKPVIQGYSLPWFLKPFSSYTAEPIIVQAPEDDTEKPTTEFIQSDRQVDLDLIHAAQALSKQVPENTTLVYSSRDGLGWFDNRGWNVFIGLNLENMEIKIAEYQATVQQLEENGILPSMISVEHIHAPFYRVD